MPAATGSSARACNKLAAGQRKDRLTEESSSARSQVARADLGHRDAPRVPLPPPTTRSALCVPWEAASTLRDRAAGESLLSRRVGFKIRGGTFGATTVRSPAAFGKRRYSRAGRRARQFGRRRMSRGRKPRTRRQRARRAQRALAAPLARSPSTVPRASWFFCAARQVCRIAGPTFASAPGRPRSASPNAHASHATAFPPSPPPLPPCPPAPRLPTLHPLPPVCIAAALVCLLRCCSPPAPQAATSRRFALAGGGRVAAIRCSRHRSATPRASRALHWARLTAHRRDSDLVLPPVGLRAPPFVNGAIAGSATSLLGERVHNALQPPSVR